MSWQNWSPLRLYPRLIPFGVLLCLQYRTSLAAITAANPIFKFGGLAFESKCDMQDHFDKVLAYENLDMLFQRVSFLL